MPLGMPEKSSEKLLGALSLGIRVPLMLLAVVAASAALYLGVWLIWRAGNFAFENWLAEPWAIAMAMLGPSRVSVAPTNPFPGSSGVERVIVVSQRVSLPDGRVLEIKQETRTRELAPGQFHTHETSFPLKTDCGCVLNALHEIIECSACSGIVCRELHTRACVECGLSFCPVCVGKGDDGSLCVKCEKRRKRRAVRRAFLGLFWRFDE
jgi:hypothetical protein